MVMSCNIHTCSISYVVNFVTRPEHVIPGWSEGPDPESRDSGLDAEFIIGPANRRDPVVSPRNDCTGQGGRDGRRFRKEAVCGAALPAYPPAIGVVADPDRRRPRDFAVLHQPDRTQSAPRDRADPAS